MKQFFKHKLSTQDIVVRQDAETESTHVEKVAGQLYPLIRIKEQTIEFANIVSFDLSSGIDNLLPTVTFTIDDAEKIYKESNYIESNDLLTIFVGNAIDTAHQPIKNDYYILNAPTDDTSGMASFHCVLHVPKIWDSPNRSFDDTSFNVLKKLAEECNLGFLSNITNTNDKMIWIQHQSTYAFIQYVVSRSFNTSDTFIKVFVDQFANLVVVDMKKLIDSSDTTLLTTFPLTGKKLDTPVPLEVSNNNAGTIEPKAHIINWSPLTNYGDGAVQYFNEVVSTSFIPQTSALTSTSSIGANIQLRKRRSFTDFTQSHVHENYNLSSIVNFNNQQLLQKTKLQILLDVYIPVIFVGMNLPVEIWNLGKHEERWSQSESVDNIDLQDVQSTGETSTGQHALNTKFSGDALLLALSIKYNRSSRKNETKHLRQLLTLFLKATK